MLVPKLSCVCIPCFNLLLQWFVLSKVPFLAFFWPDIKQNVCVIYMYLKHSPDYIDSKYVGSWV